MSNIHKKPQKTRKKDLINTGIRKKLGITQAELATILHISRAYVTLAESGRRSIGSTLNTMLLNIYHHFHELETGRQVSDRSPETRLFLNDEYKKILPQMKAREQECRGKIKQLKKEMEKMKERARDAGNAIIVFSAAVKNLEEEDKPGNTNEPRVAGLQVLKQKAYDNLLTCWEPEQAKLHCKIEAIAGEAKALRRYRVKVVREHDPFKVK